ncbi:MAG: lysophospholipid acyltransferase family protein [Candidatus Omnitrophica bacterium]|nr:lysophospholipid acyltransferase family protein [Candidatus Omnitrophota bacterium]
MKIREIIPGWDFIEFSLVRAFIGLVNLFPIGASTWLAGKIGEAMFVILPSRRKIALENLNVAFGETKTDREKRDIALGSFRHLAISLMEFFRLPKFVKKSQGHVQLKGTEHLDRAFANGKGAILVMSHLGPWEYLVFLSYLKKYPTTVLGRPIRNPYFYRWIKSLRNLMELKHSDKTMGPREIFSELRKNHLVAITIDQWAGNEGLWTYFFNVPTSTTSLPARLAKRTGAALVPAYCIRIGSGQYEVHVEPEVFINEDKNSDKWVEKMTARLNSTLEKQIRVFPSQWTWTHKRWKKRGYPIKIAGNQTQR